MIQGIVHETTESSVRLDRTVSTSMSTNQIALPEKGAEQSTQEIRLRLTEPCKHDWSLWGAAVVVILSLTAAVASFSSGLRPSRKTPSMSFTSASLFAAYLGLVLLFSVYTLYQQFSLSEHVVNSRNK